MRRSVRWITAALVAGACLATGGPPALAAGVSGTPAPSPRATTGPVDLTPPGGESRAVRVNTRGDIVGSTTPVPDGLYTGRLWSGHGYRATSLGVLGTQAQAVNDRGDVVGCTGSGIGLIWRGGHLTRVSVPGQSICFYDINEAGQVAAAIAPASGGPSRSFLWQHGRFTDLGTPKGHGSYPTAINDRGQIVGRLIGGATSIPARTFVWSDGRFTDIGTLGGDQAIPVALNENGTVIGVGTLAGGGQHPFRWRKGKFTDLLAGTGIVDNNAYPNALNDAGDVVGTVNSRPVLWKNGVLTYLAPAAVPGEATGINARGQVTGVVRTSADEPIVFRWTRGSLVRLPKLTGQNFSYAVDIDDRGRVVGNVTAGPDNLHHAVIWTH